MFTSKTTIGTIKLNCSRRAEALQEKGRIEYLKEVKGASNTTFWEWVHKDCDDYTRLDRRLQWELKRKWDEIQDYHQSIKHYPYEKAYENYDDSQRKLMEELDDYLIKDDYSNFINEGEEEFNKRKCKLLGITYHNPPMMISEKFEVIKYSLGTCEEYVAIKTKEFIRLTRSEENVSQLYGNILRMKYEGWDVIIIK